MWERGSNRRILTFVGQIVAFGGNSDDAENCTGGVIRLNRLYDYITP